MLNGFGAKRVFTSINQYFLAPEKREHTFCDLGRDDRILAGKNRAFRRLIGAPYWSVEKGRNNRLQNIFEFNRMEVSWNAEESTELFGEGGRPPRTVCPAAYLELLDMALRADGGVDGILNYGIDWWNRTVPTQASPPSTVPSVWRATAYIFRISLLSPLRDLK